jgi:hypothetical protein
VYNHEEEPSPFVQYTYFSEPEQSYVEYVPQVPSWVDYNEPSVESLYTYNVYTGAYEIESSPSPYEEYWTFEASTQSYVPYLPTPAVWSNYYSLPQEPLYTYDIATNSYFVEVEPSPYMSYFTYSTDEESFVEYVPTDYGYTVQYE